ncbi:VOC family protein [Cupriavidus sp. 2TAF22]|uniref:VOC family protein n=1 Tax=unclassified Cupriavidus TaxID=2640874 RepID=UPI003F910C5D
MANLTATELKAFVPARDFALSRQFYQDLGFASPWHDDTLAYLHHGNCSFLLQNFYVREFAENLMMHLLVEDVEAWWQKVQQQDIGGRYGVRLVPPQDQPWKMRDFVLIDPSGVLWRIGQNIG